MSDNAPPPPFGGDVPPTAGGEVPPTVVGSVVGSEVPAPVRRCDPLAAALGNATLLGVGYLLLRRWGAMVGTLITTGLLVWLVVAFGQPGWFWRAVLGAWWVITTLFGWLRARQSQRAPVTAEGGSAWGQRAIAACVAVVLGLAVVAIAIDVRRIESGVASAHEAGDCEAAVQGVDRIAFWHRLVDPYVTRRAADEVAACNLVLAALDEDDPQKAADVLAQYLESGSARWKGASDLRADRLLTVAENELDKALDGDLTQLQYAFTVLAGVLAQTPSRASAVDNVLDGYLRRLSEVDPCVARSHLTWLTERSPSGNQLDRAVQEVDQIGPKVLLACGDKRLKTNATEARSAYQALLDRYPDDQLAKDARAGVEKAETQIELDIVRDRVRDRSTDYCDNPAPYRGAPRYQGHGPHRLLPLGSVDFADDIPSKWRAKDPAEATLVLCVDGPKFGQRLRTCNYEQGHQVALHATAYEVQAFELRTGKKAFETTIQLRGDCPYILRWQCSSYNYNCPPPPKIRASYSDSAFRSAIQPWVLR